MNRRTRIRRVALLCTHFARNIAYYRGGWDGQTLKRQGDFWKTINGNCLDIAVLEWCKLFADKKDPHFWGNVVTDSKGFKKGLLKEIKMPDDDFDAYIKTVRAYRDKFVAHLDDDLTAHIPGLDTAWTAVQHYHNHLVKSETEAGDLIHLPTDLEKYYESNEEVARTHFGASEPSRD